MTPPRRAGGPLAALALLLLVLGAAAAPAAAGSGGQAGGSTFAQTTAPVDPDAVLLAVDLRADGSASWRVEYRVRLDDENTTAAFEALRADVEANESAYASRFEERMAATVGDAASATGREMALRNVSVRATTEQLPQRYGVLAYAFEWTNFATVEGGEIRAGDALAGLFLDADSTLLVSWPEGHSVADVSPRPTEQRERSVLWRGPTDFGPGEPALVLSAAAGPGDRGTSPVGIAVVALVLLGGGGLLWWRSRSGRGPGGRTAGPSGDTPSGPPEELLSNEERVVALLEARGGRMKQQDVVDALGWTDAKTSQVVGELRDAGRIEGFRLGRENVLRLPEADDAPAAGGPPPGDDDREG